MKLVQASPSIHVFTWHPSISKMCLVFLQNKAVAATIKDKHAKSKHACSPPASNQTATVCHICFFYHLFAIKYHNEISRQPAQYTTQNMPASLVKSTAEPPADRRCHRQAADRLAQTMNQKQTDVASYVLTPPVQSAKTIRNHFSNNCFIYPTALS